MYSDYCWRTPWTQCWVDPQIFQCEEQCCRRHQVRRCTDPRWSGSWGSVFYMHISNKINDVIAERLYFWEFRYMLRAWYTCSFVAFTGQPVLFWNNRANMQPLHRLHWLDVLSIPKTYVAMRDPESSTQANRTNFFKLVTLSSLRYGDSMIVHQHIVSTRSLSLRVWMATIKILSTPSWKYTTNVRMVSLFYKRNIISGKL